MTRIEHTFKALNRPALVAFITAGDPDYEASLSIMRALPGAGADIIELGMPFSDPMADGPVIEAASGRALKNGMTLTRVLDMVRAFREGNKDTPIVLMGYANPLFAYGFEKFAQDAATAGVDGLIIVDLPPEEDEMLRGAAQQNGLDLIRLVTPVTDETRLKTLLEGASGFLYYVSITGVTGTASADPETVGAHIKTIKAHTDLPVAVGFGIKTPEDAAKMGKIADAVVVGSAIVQNIADHNGMADIDQVIEKQVKILSGALG